MQPRKTSSSSSSRDGYKPPVSTGWIKAGEASTRVHSREPESGSSRDGHTATTIAKPRHQSSPPQLESKSSKWMLDMDTFSKAMSTTKTKLFSQDAKGKGRGRGRGKGKERAPSKIFWDPDEYYKNKEKVEREKEREKERERERQAQLIPSPSQRQQSHEFDAPSSPSSLAKELTSDKALSQLARMRQAAGLSPVDEEKRAKDRLTMLRERRVDLEMRKALIANQDTSDKVSSTRDSFQSHLATLANFSKRLNQVTIPALKSSSNKRRRKYTQDDSNTAAPAQRSETLEDLEQYQHDDEMLFTQHNSADSGYRTFTQILSERTPKKPRSSGSRSILVDKTPSPASSKSLRQTTLNHAQSTTNPVNPIKRTEIPSGAIGFPELERAWEGARPIVQNPTVRNRKRDSEQDKKRQSLISGWISQSQSQSQSQRDDDAQEELSDEPQKRLFGGMDMDSTDRPNVSLDVDSDYEDDEEKEILGQRYADHTIHAHQLVDADADADDQEDAESLDIETPQRKRTRSLPLDFLHDDSPSSERAVASLVNATQIQTQSQSQSQNSSGSLPTPHSNIPGMQNLMQNKYN